MHRKRRRKKLEQQTMEDNNAAPPSRHSRCSSAPLFKLNIVVYNVNFRVNWSTIFEQKTCQNLLPTNNIIEPSMSPILLSPSPMASVGRNLLRRSLAQARTHDSADASTSDGHAPYTPAQLIVVFLFFCDSTYASTSDGSGPRPKWTHVPSTARRCHSPPDWLLYFFSVAHLKFTTR